MEERIRQNEIRKDIINYTKKILKGPGSEKGTHSDEYEKISESPFQRYLTGILYPTENKVNTEGPEESDLEEMTGLEEDLNVIDNDYHPKTMGITFYLDNTVSEIGVNFKTATYVKEKISAVELTQSDFEDFKVGMQNYPQICSIFTLDKNKKSIELIEAEKNIETLTDFNKEGKVNNGDKIKKNWNIRENIVFFSYIRKLENFFKNGSFTRNPFEKNLTVSLFRQRNEKIIEISEYEKIKIITFVKEIPVVVKNQKIKAVTIVAQNVGKEKLFQSQITVEKTNEINKMINFIASEDISLKDISKMDFDEKNNFLLYRNHKTFAVGHGVSAQWELNNESIPVKVMTDYMPTYEIKPMEFKIKSLEEFDIFSAANYVKDDFPSQMTKMNKFVTYYEDWILQSEEKVVELPEELQETAWDNISKCYHSAERMKKSVQLLSENESAYKAFRFANEAMILQRMDDVHLKEEAYNTKNYGRKTLEWRPFQFAFILNSLESILNEDSEERNVLDLIWVSTGGGKTEAYLFAIAMTIFYRRLAHPESHQGVSVIMRYTLRLLTAQQFERASALICACEFMRKKKDSDLGTEEISIGLWVGSASTPNRRQKASEEVVNLQNKTSLEQAKNVNQFQILKCPWCFKEDSIFPRKENIQSGASRYWGIVKSNKSNKYHNIKCSNKDCHFNKWLPIHVVDQEIYEHRPTLLFGTVDKFARVPLVDEAAYLFGSDKNDYRRPELVIQDELHLISGPLGSMVGLYEAAFDFILSGSGVKPKYIASTATIRNAEEQVKNLFDRSFQQFPAAGLDADDNCFIRTNNEEFGRKFLGIMGTGKTQITTEIRLVASLIQSVSDLNLSVEEREIYWTVAGYFNSIRELGKMTTLIKDDIDDYLLILRQRNIERKRPVNTAVELTSRIESGKIKDIINQLEKTHDQKDSVDILTATNMLSVGIDISRLNSMFVVGQPKLTSEYIQATSRVGRKDLGLVSMLYNSTRSRDRSHYETFQSYHQSLYKYVEPSSVTPYSIPSLKKALAASMVTMARNIKPSNISNRSASNISHGELIKIRNHLTGRIRKSDIVEGFYEKDATNILNDMIERWEELIRSNKDIRYYLSKNDSKNADNDLVKYLLRDFDDKSSHNEAEFAMSSMRNVDEAAYLNIID